MKIPMMEKMIFLTENMMKLHKILLLKFLILYTAFATPIHAGVIISCELPQSICQMVQDKQALLRVMIQKMNEQQSTAYIVQDTQFAPHISLAYVGQNALSVRQIDAQYPALLTDLQNIAQHHAIIDLTPHIAHATVEFWPIQSATDSSGIAKKSYLNVVLKIAENPALVRLATNLHDVLKETGGITQPFPFIAHITLGKIYENNGQFPDAADLKKLASDLQADLANSMSDVTTICHTFSLTGHDHSEVTFELAEEIDHKNNLYRGCFLR
jgi:2'-5' RNA ligase